MKAIIVLQSGKVLNKDLPKFFDDLPTNAKNTRGMHSTSKESMDINAKNMEPS